MSPALPAARRAFGGSRSVPSPWRMAITHGAHEREEPGKRRRSRLAACCRVSGRPRRAATRANVRRRCLNQPPRRATARSPPPVADASQARAPERRRGAGVVAFVAEHLALGQKCHFLHPRARHGAPLRAPAREARVTCDVKLGV